jgi:NitT/TauT family transport system substrate-binding protein
MNNPIRAFVAGLAVVAVLAGCGGGDEGPATGGDSGTQAAQPAKITFAIASAVIGPKEEVAVIAAGKELGYFAEEKLTVDTINADGSIAAVQAVASNSAQVTAADTGSILAAAEKRVPIKAIGGLVQNWPWVMAVKPDSPINSAADLKGKNIGVISLASGSAPYARAYVSEAGLDPTKDVQLLPVGVGPQAAAALSSGKVDALALYTQAYSVIENAGTKLKYLDNPELFQGIRSLSFAVRDSSLQRDKAVYERFLRAAYKSLLFSAANPEAAMKIGYKVYPQILAGQTPETRLANDMKNLVAWLKTATPASGTPENWDEWGNVSEEEWKKTVEYTKGAGQIKADVPLDRVWDDSLLKAANDFDAQAVLDKAKNYQG